MKTILIATLVASLCAMTVCAADDGTMRQGPGRFAADNAHNPERQKPSIEQKKTEILQRIDERIGRNQAEKACVQSAKSHDELKACRDRFRPKPRENQQGERP